MMGEQTFAGELLDLVTGLIWRIINVSKEGSVLILVYSKGLGGVRVDLKPFRLQERLWI